MYIMSAFVLFFKSKLKVFNVVPSKDFGLEMTREPRWSYLEQPAELIMDKVV